MKRIFVAVDISEEARRKTAAYVESLRNDFGRVRVGWERAEKLHLTLKFLGDADDGQLRELEEIVEKISGEMMNFQLQITETGVFSAARNPRVLWLDVVDESGNLARINNRLEAECEKIGFARERRPFVPHLTIGRVRVPAGAKDLARKHLEKGFAPVDFEVSEIVIYESKLLPTGSVYGVVSRHSLMKEGEKGRRGEGETIFL